MKLDSIVTDAINKSTFKDLNGYIDFCKRYLEYISIHLQAIIVSQNENNYRFFQYDETGNYQITRPINSLLMYSFDDFLETGEEFLKLLKQVKSFDSSCVRERNILNNSVYTIQQSIGAALDALPVGKSNTARKLNGDLFEYLIRLIINEIGVSCKAGVVQVPVIINNVKQFNMSYQHDMIINTNNEIKILGSIKTSSKDRIAKIFLDKFLYCKLTETTIPHIAIFLNDVQRKKTKKENEYGISSTFLPGHFKAFTIKLNPLDGVYYCDIRPNMKNQDILKDHIKSFDYLICEDLWKFID